MASNGLSFSFAESSPRIRRELRKKELQLQKEFSLMEKQSRTNTNNISNHQQVLKNSWRRLEQKKLEDQHTPLESRSRKKNQPVADKTKRLMFSNRTAISVEKAPSTTTHHSVDGDELTSSSSLPHLQTKGNGDLSSNSKSRLLPSIITTNHHQPGGSSPSLHSRSGRFGTADHEQGAVFKSIQRSPFVSSPYSFRRPPQLHNGGPALLIPGQHSTSASSYRSSSTGHSSPHPLMKTSNKGNGQKSTTTGLSNTADLPSLDASINTKTRMLSSLSTKRMSKDALLKVGKLLEMSDASTGGGGSRGPESFKKFYESSAPSSSSDVSNPALSQLPQFTLNDLEEMSEEEFMKSLTEEEKEQVQTAKDENSELTLAEMFEQIRNCRYIRLYHPYGAKDDDNEEQNQ